MHQSKINWVKFPILLSVLLFTNCLLLIDDVRVEYQIESNGYVEVSYKEDGHIIEYRNVPNLRIVQFVEPGTEYYVNVESIDSTKVELSVYINGTLKQNFKCEKKQCSLEYGSRVY